MSDQFAATDMEQLSSPIATENATTSPQYRRAL